MTFRPRPFGRRRPWTLCVGDRPARAYELASLASGTERQRPAQALMCDAATPLVELTLRARVVEAKLDLTGERGLPVAELRGVRDASAGAGPLLRRAVDAHGREVGYLTRAWHERAARVTDTLLAQHAGTLPAEVAALAGVELALTATRRDQMAVPGHLAAATGRVDAVRALASALLSER